MCKKLIYLVSAFMVVGLIGPVAAQQVDMEIGFAAQPPVIDGEVDGTWEGASTQYLVPVGDPANASGGWKALYDSVNLYVIMDINDDSLMNDSADSWQDDSVEFYFDGGNTKEDTPLAGDNRQYTFGWTTEDVQGVNTQIEGVEHAQVDTDTGWRIEIKFPWLSLQDTEPQAGDLIGIDCFYNDDDDGGDSREGKILTFAAEEAWNDASQWGTAMLTAIPEPTEGPKIIWVGDAHDAANPGTPDDQGWVDLLEANGYIVDYQKNVPGTGPWQGDLGDEQIGALNRADLVIISRDASTGGHNRPDAWNSIEAPVLSLNNYMARSSRWQWVNSTAINARQSYYDLKADDPEHPIFAGVELDPNSQVVWFDPAAGSGYAGFFDANDVGNGYLIASRPDNGNLLIAEWEAGVPFYEGTDQLPAGKRMLFCAGNQEIGGTNEFFGAYNLSAEGEKMFLNAVEYMIPVKPVDPGSDGLVAFYALENDVNDSSGNELHGTIVGDPNFVEGPAGYGMAMEFHGLGAPGGGGDYIDCGNDASLDITGPISMALWIRPGADDPEGQGTETAPMAKAMDGVGWSWQVRYGWGSPQPYMAFTFNSSPRAWAYVGRNLERDEWCHIACSHDGTTLKCYLNGEQTDSTPMGQITSSEAPVLIGSDGWGCDWIGAIDEVAIYNRDLSAGEVRYLAGFRAMVDPGTDGLAAAYYFETDATDSSGNGNDGTLLGDAHAQGGLLVLDGEGDAVAIPRIGGADATFSEFTYSMMVYPTVDQTPLQFSGGLNTNDWSSGAVHLKLNNGNVNVGINGLAGGDLAGTTIAQPNTWTHLALTVSETEVAVYLNGELEDSRTLEAPLTNLTVGGGVIGGWAHPDVDREMTGQMDNVLIYDRALSEAEVRYLASLRTDAVNLLPNPSFEEDELILDDPDWVGWCTWNPAEGAGSNATIVDTEAIGGTKSLRVDPIGAENWYFILVNISFPADLDKNYTAGFWAKAEAPRPLTVQMKASDNSVDAWGATDFELTTEWTEYTYTSEALHTDVKLEFLCAGSEVPFWLDLVSVYEAE